jgi:RNA polymerase sigma-70 factor (ECF subfamily)
VFSWREGRIVTSEERERELLRSAREGDRAAAEAICQRHWRDVYRLLYARLGNRSEAEDLTQETFARFWRALPRIQGAEAGAYIRTIALNLVRNYLRDEARHPRASLAEEDGGAPSAEEEALEQMGRDELLALFGTLTSEQGRVLRLRLLEGLSVAEVAVRLGRSPEAVRALQHRALVHLRDHLRSTTTAGRRCGDGCGGALGRH